MKKTIIICMFFMLSSCNSPKKDNEYLGALSFFDSKTVNHFPKSGLNKEQDILIKDVYHYHNTLSLILMRNSNLDEIKKMESLYENNYLNLNDSCVIVLNDFLLKENIGDPFYGQKNKFNESCKTYKTVPNFFELEFKKNLAINNLPKDFSIYLIETKKGDFSKEIDKTKSSMPNSFLHGYSKGIAISRVRSKIIYWTIIW